MPIEQDKTRCHQEGPSVCKDRHISAAVLEEIVLSNLKRRLLTPERSGSVLQIGAPQITDDVLPEGRNLGARADFQ